MGHISVGDAARRLGAKPKDISDLFYGRALRDDLCPVVGGRRLIPEDYIDAIRTALRRAGKPVMPAAADPAGSAERSQNRRDLADSAATQSPA